MHTQQALLRIKAIKECHNEMIMKRRAEHNEVRIGPPAARMIARRIEAQHGFWDIHRLIKPVDTNPAG